MKVIQVPKPFTLLKKGEEWLKLPGEVSELNFFSLTQLIMDSQKEENMIRLC